MTNSVFDPEKALFRNFFVNHALGVTGLESACAAYESAPPRDTAAFLELAKNCKFLDRKHFYQQCRMMLFYYCPFSLEWVVPTAGTNRGFYSCGVQQYASPLIPPRRDAAFLDEKIIHSWIGN
ncbi:MAG: hypothetical protein WBM78_25520 [Desulfobacterales bacterium]